MGTRGKKAVAAKQKVALLSEAKALRIINDLGWDPPPFFAASSFSSLSTPVLGIFL